jgi:hypothetical protein
VHVRGEMRDESSGYKVEETVCKWLKNDEASIRAIFLGDLTGYNLRLHASLLLRLYDDSHSQRV